MPPDHPQPGANPHYNPEALRHRPVRWLRPAAVAGAGLAAIIVVAGLAARGFADEDLKRTATQAAIPTVQLIAPSSDASAEPLTLPADVQADDSAQIHARVSGYVRRWLVDIGAPVKAGQLLAEIDTPDLDQQLAQARAALGTAEANQNLAKISANRWNRLLTKDAVSHQEADEKAGDLAAKTAAVLAAKADVDRLVALKGFTRIISPFDGVVTGRNAHVGALVTANSASEPALFTVADEHRLRIYVHVPQSYSSQIKAGMKAEVSVPEHPGQTFAATLTSTSEAVGEQSGALTAELQIDNARRLLKPGDYAQATFKLAAQNGALIRLPSSALLFEQTGMAVGVVDGQGRAHIRPVTLRRNLGATVEIAAGVQPSDRVINNPPDSLAEGEKVRITTAGA